MRERLSQPAVHICIFQLKRGRTSCLHNCQQREVDRQRQSATVERANECLDRGRPPGTVLCLYRRRYGESAILSFHGPLKCYAECARTTASTAAPSAYDAPRRSDADARTALPGRIRGSRVDGWRPGILDSVPRIVSRHGQGFSKSRVERSERGFCVVALSRDVRNS